MHMGPIDLSKLQKKFCDNIAAAFSQEFFLMGMFSGEEREVYALTPQHMKRLSQYLTTQVAEYEKKFGEIDAAWKPSIESPIQTKDLSKN